MNHTVEKAIALLNVFRRCGEMTYAVYSVLYDEISSLGKQLKEQEPVKPNGDNCGKCGYTLHRIIYDGPDKELRHERFRFCPSCGKMVKWSD